MSEIAFKINDLPRRMQIEAVEDDGKKVMVLTKHKLNFATTYDRNTMIDGGLIGRLRHKVDGNEFQQVSQMLMRDSQYSMRS